ncbi:MAG: DUF393 domain-containing protein [Verrucomicrobiota bacterium]
MNTITVYFDGECAFCTRWARRGSRLGFRFVPFANGRAEGEVRVVTEAGATLGGVDAIAYLCRQVWWLWPVWLLSRLPGMGRVYQWVAAHRYFLNGTCQRERTHVCAVAKLTHELSGPVSEETARTPRGAACFTTNRRRVEVFMGGMDALVLSRCGLLGWNVAKTKRKE